jgi:hypothetical protein
MQETFQLGEKTYKYQTLHSTDTYWLKKEIPKMYKNNAKRSHLAHYHTERTSFVEQYSNKICY